jgi:hypothetical protein
MRIERPRDRWREAVELAKIIVHTALFLMVLPLEMLKPGECPICGRTIPPLRGRCRSCFPSVP